MGLMTPEGKEAGPGRGRAVCADEACVVDHLAVRNLFRAATLNNNVMDGWSRRN